MIEYYTNRTEITKRVLGLIHPDHSEWDLRNAVLTWWVNIRTQGGLGLSETGNSKFEIAKLEYCTFEVDIPTPTIYVIAMRCDRAVPCPYYLRYIQRKRYISVYDSRVAVMIQLHGSFASYLDSMEKDSDRTET